MKEARKTGRNQRAPASSPPLPLGNRLSGPRAAVADPCVTAPPAMGGYHLTFTMTGRDCSGLTPDQNRAQQPRGARCYRSQLKCRPADAQHQPEASAWRAAGLNLLIPQQHLQGDPRPTPLTRGYCERTAGRRLLQTPARKDDLLSVDSGASRSVWDVSLSISSGWRGGNQPRAWFHLTAIGIQDPISK